MVTLTVRIYGRWVWWLFSVNSSTWKLRQEDQYYSLGYIVSWRDQVGLFDEVLPAHRSKTILKTL
jgi:hypothetical protein